MAQFVKKNHYIEKKIITLIKKYLIIFKMHINNYRFTSFLDSPARLLKEAS